MKRKMDAFKRSQLPFGYVMLIRITMSLPHAIRDALIEIFGSKMTFVFSNVPGPT